MKHKGWIKLHRKLLECWIWVDEEPFDKRSAWVDLILSANHSDKKILFNGELIVIKRGQILTSIRKLAEKWKWSINRVYRFLKLLESDGMLNRESDKDRTLLTLLNYEVYQVPENSDENTNENTNENTIGNSSDTPTATPTETKQEYKECINNDKKCNKNGEYNSEPPTEHFDLEKNAAVLFRQWGNKNGFANMKVEWLNRFMGVPERNWMQLANLILEAVKAYKEEYKRTHPDEKVDYQYLKTMDKFFQEDLDYWLAEVQRRKESEE